MRQADGSVQVAAAAILLGLTMGTACTGEAQPVYGSYGPFAGGGFGGSSVGGSGTTGGGKGGVGGSGGVIGGGAVDCTPEVCKQPPAMGTGGPPDGAAPNVQAINKLYLGDTTRAGVMTPTAWQDYGFAISGIIYSNAKLGAAAHCKPYGGAAAADVVVNGTNGVDNSFGRNVVPILLGLASDFPQKLQDAIDAGGSTVLMKTDKLGLGTDYNGLTTTVYSSKGTGDGMGCTLAPPPTDWSSYTWHPFDSEKAGVAFPSSYLVKNQWVSGPGGDIRVILSLAGYELVLAIHQAQMAHTFSADHTTATLGDIGGVLGVDQLAAAIEHILGKFSPNLCHGTAQDFVLKQIRQAADIRQDGVRDPSQTCDSVSIGLGYETTASQLGDPAPPAKAKDPCASPGPVCPK